MKYVLSAIVLIGSGIYLGMHMPTQKLQTNTTQLNGLVLGASCNINNAYTIDKTNGLQCYGYGDTSKGETRQGIWIKPDLTALNSTANMIINDAITWQNFTSKDKRINFPYPRGVNVTETSDGIRVFYDKYDLLNVKNINANVAKDLDNGINGEPAADSSMIIKNDYYNNVMPDTTTAKAFIELGRDTGNTRQTEAYLFTTQDGYNVVANNLSKQLGFEDDYALYVSSYMISHLMVK
jgi:hypothetical protein